MARAAVVAPRFTPVRFYAASAGLSKSDIESRILDVLKTFEKVDPSKVRFWSCPIVAGSVWRVRGYAQPTLGTVHSRQMAATDVAATLLL